MQAIPYAEAVARKFRLERAPTLLAQREVVTPIAFTRLRSEGPFRGRTMATPPEEAFSFLVALAPMQAGEVWIDGQYSLLPAASRGRRVYLQPRGKPGRHVETALQFVAGSMLLVRHAGSTGPRRQSAASQGGLRTTSIGAQDPRNAGAGSGDSARA